MKLKPRDRSPWRTDREPRRVGPALPPGLEGRAGGFVTVHHVCDRYACYTNMLSQRTHVYHREDERWAWVGSWDNSDHAVGWIKWMKGEGPKPLVERLEDREASKPPSVEARREAAGQPDFRARQRLGVRRLVEEGLRDMRKRVRQGDHEGLADEADGLRKLIGVYQELGGPPGWAKDHDRWIDEALERAVAAPKP